MPRVGPFPTSSPRAAALAVALVLASSRLSAGLGGGGAAPSPPPVAAPAPPVEALVAEALASSPELAALQARVAAAREMEPPAAALPDPMIEAALQNVSLSRNTVGKDENSMLGAEVRQGLPFPGKRNARRAVAAADTRVAEAELALHERAVATAVRIGYSRLYALDAEAASLAAAHEILAMFSATAQSRYSSGAGDQEALLKAQLEVSRVAERENDLTAERVAAVAELDRLLGRPGTPLGQVSQLPPVAVPGGPCQEAAISGSPEVARARADVEAAARRLDVARLDLRPDFSAGAGLGYRGSLDPIVTLRFGIELPLWRRRKQEPLTRAAAEDLEAARRRLAGAEIAARAAALRLGARWTAARQSIRLYREGIVPQTSAAMDAARISYLNGRGDFTTLIQDFGLWLTARTGLASREAESFAAWAEIQELLSSGTAAASSTNPPSGGGTR